jgi:photosystem II stability/assembly factor-like uncharacterized protein
MKYRIIIFYIIISVFQVVYSQTGWVLQNSGVSIQVNDIHFVNHNTGFAVCNNSTLLRTTNGGVNWTPYTISNYSLYKVRFFDENTGMIGSNGRILKSTNSGLNWAISYNSAGGLECWLLNPNTIYFQEGLSLTISTDRGQSWTYKTAGTTTGGVSFINQNTGWINSYSYYAPPPWLSITVLKTTDGGNNWASVFSTLTAYCNCTFLGDIFFINETSGFSVWRLFNIGRIVKTTTGGSQWGYPGYEVPHFQNSLYFTSVNRGWTCGDNGSIFNTDNSGSNWYQQPTPNSSNLLGIFFIDSLTGWACGTNGTIIKTTNGGVTALNPISSEIPNKFNLLQNYPNPFNPVTNIKFDIPKKSNVKILIYDILGREIDVLFNESLNAGSYQADWDASNFPSGVYFYKLVTEEFSESKKMILIK